MNTECIKQHIRVVEGFPTPGISFKDITGVLANPVAYQQVVDWLVAEAKVAQCTKVVGLGARGFFFAPAVALALKLPFIPIRKAGKLPGDTWQAKYELEYGTNVFELHKADVVPGDRVLVIDDLLATGGSLRAACDLIALAEADVVSILTVIELQALQGRQKVARWPLKSMVVY